MLATIFRPRTPATVFINFLRKNYQGNETDRVSVALRALARIQVVGSHLADFIGGLVGIIIGMHFYNQYVWSVGLIILFVTSVTLIYSFVYEIGTKTNPCCTHPTEPNEWCMEVRNRSQVSGSNTDTPHSHTPKYEVASEDDLSVGVGTDADGFLSAPKTSATSSSSSSAIPIKPMNVVSSSQIEHTSDDTTATATDTLTSALSFHSPSFRPLAAIVRAIQQSQATLWVMCFVQYILYIMLYTAYLIQSLKYLSSDDASAASVTFFMFIQFSASLLVIFLPPPFSTKGLSITSFVIGFVSIGYWFYLMFSNTSILGALIGSYCFIFVTTVTLASIKKYPLTLLLDANTGQNETQEINVICWFGASETTAEFMFFLVYYYVTYRQVIHAYLGLGLFIMAFTLVLRYAIERRSHIEERESGLYAAVGAPVAVGQATTTTTLATVRKVYGLVAYRSAAPGAPRMILRQADGADMKWKPDTGDVGVTVADVSAPATAVAPVVSTTLTPAPAVIAVAAEPAAPSAAEKTASSPKSDTPAIISSTDISAAVAAASPAGAGAL